MKTMHFPPEERSDTLFGSGKNVVSGWREDKTTWNVPVSIGMNEVEGIEKYYPETLKTVALTLGIAVMVVGGVILIAYAHGIHGIQNTR